jgi:hypothetical protein
MPPRQLTDEAWADLCAAAKRHKPPLTPDAEARAKMAAVLFDWYPAFAYDPARAELALALSERMLGHINAFAGLYHQAWLSHLPVEDFRRLLSVPASLFPDNVQTGFHLLGMRRLRSYVEANVLYYRIIRSANARNASVQREMLYHWLCDIWLENFGALRLKRGALIAFMLAAMKPILAPGALPSRGALSDAIKRERKQRENVAQLCFEFERRMVVA